MTILFPDKEILDEIQQILAKLVDVDYKDETKFREIEDFDKEIQEIKKWDEGIAYGSCYSHIGAYQIENGRVTELILFALTSFDEYDESNPENAEYYKRAFHIIDERIGELQEIKKLAIMKCALTKVPPSIYNLPKLEYSICVITILSNLIFRIYQSYIF